MAIFYWGESIEPGDWLMDNIYEKLRARLDELATGYPETGAETYIRIMQERGKI